MQGQSHKRILGHTFNLIEQYFKGSRATFQGENEKLSYSERREISLIQCSLKWVCSVPKQ